MASLVDGARLEEALVKLLQTAVSDLPSDVETAIRAAYSEENCRAARIQLECILRNIEAARERGLPMCQDTGSHLFFVKIGTQAGLDVSSIETQIRRSVERATLEGILIPNAINPFTGENPGTNVGRRMPYVAYKVVPGCDAVDVLVLPKGGGSENASALVMLKPSDGLERVKECVIRKVAETAAAACPPGILGVGIGGSSDIAMSLAKEAILRPVGSRNEDPEIARFERDLKEKINGLGIGPMGLGGKTTVLAVHVEYSYCRTGSLPVGICFQCWAARRATLRIEQGGASMRILESGVAV